MRGGVARSIPISFFLLPVAVAGLSNSVCAQARRPTAAPPPGSYSNPNTQPPSILERQYLMRAIEIDASKPPPTAEQKRLALAQIAEDYTQIQIINNKMMSATFRAPVPNYASIAERTAQIGKRAGRIKTNLPLPADDKSDADAKPPEYHSVVDPATMKASLLSLDARIMSFVNNPIFKNTSVVEVTEAARAKRDLDNIVEFSNRIGKDAKRLSRSDKGR